MGMEVFTVTEVTIAGVVMGILVLLYALFSKQEFYVKATAIIYMALVLVMFGYVIRLATVGLDTVGYLDIILIGCSMTISILGIKKAVEI